MSEDDIVYRLMTWSDVTELVDEAIQEIELLRRLGDTLAHWVRAGEAKEMYAAVHAWEEARRGH